MTKLVLFRASYSYEIYSGVYKSKFKIGQKQVESPMALMQLGAFLKKAGIEVRIIDAEVLNLDKQALVQQIIQLNPDFVGGTSTTPEIDYLIDILNDVKRINPNITTIIGGAHPTHVPWTIAEIPASPDYIVMYEGEKALKAICTNDHVKLKEYYENVKEITLQLGGTKIKNTFGKILLGEVMTTEELDTNFPLRSLPEINMEHYRSADPAFGLMVSDSIETARGCPYSCSFCSSAKSGLGLRSVDSVLEELDIIHSGKNSPKEKMFIAFLDDTLTFNRQRASELFNGIKNKPYKIRFRAFTRANTIATNNGLNDDLIFAELMRDAGSSVISFGVETGSEKILERMKKGVRLEDYVNAYSILEKIGFQERRASFIVGHPYENEQTIKESISFAKKLKINRIGVHIMTPYPGTDVYKDAIEGNGIYFEKGAYNYSNYKRYGNSIVSTEYLSPDALKHWQKIFLTQIYASPSNLQFSGAAILKGNLSRYYHRPTLEALKGKLTLRTNLSFSKPNHSNYDSTDWDTPHFTKNQCVRFLSTRYDRKFNRQKKSPQMGGEGVF